MDQQAEDRAAELAILAPAAAAPWQSQTNRVVVRSNFIHCPDNGAMQSWGKPRSYTISSAEQAWERFLTVGEAWQRLDFGWIADPSLVWIENLTNAHAAAKAVELAACEGAPPLAIVRSGRDACFEPLGGQLAIRSVAGEVRIRVVALPR